MRDNTSFGSNPARRKIVIAALAACVALPTLFVLTHGNAKPNPQPFAPPAGAQAAAPSQPKTQTVSHHPIETFQVFAPRDPFEPVVISGGATGSGTSSTSSSTPSPGTSTTTDTSGSSNSDGSTAVSGHRIKLIDTFPQGGGEKARIQVDDTVYTVAPGETFATNFKLLSIQNKCITAFFGDDQFSLCEGEEILK